MSFTQHFPAISRVSSHFLHICSFLQCEYCEIGNASMGFSKSLMPKIPYKSLVFDSWFDRIFGICDLENPILTFPPHSILSLLKNTYDLKGQFISKGPVSVATFSQKTNKNKSTSSKDELFRSFFGRKWKIYKTFWKNLTFTEMKIDSSISDSKFLSIKNKHFIWVLKWK